LLDVSPVDPAMAHALVTDPPLEGCSVLVVDADPIMRAGWGSVLGAQPWVGRCASAPDLAGAIAELAGFPFDIALVGLFLEDEHGVEICLRLRDQDPALKVVLVTDAAGLPIRAARAAGACGLVHRGWTLDAIVDAVTRAADGEQAFPAPSSRAVGACRLSRRERTVLSLLARGASNVEIAGVLHLSPHTIKEYTQAVFRKLGVRNRVEAATAAARLGYAD
jgi:DNA-binding NarL/FixJ family response regulator